MGAATIPYTNKMAIGRGEEANREKRAKHNRKLSAANGTAPGSKKPKSAEVSKALYLKDLLRAVTASISRRRSRNIRSNANQWVPWVGDTREDTVVSTGTTFGGFRFGGRERWPVSYVDWE